MEYLDVNSLKNLDEIKSIFMSFYYKLNTANDCYRLYKRIMEEKNISIYSNQYIDLYLMMKTIDYALMNSSIMEIAKLYDTDKRTFSLHYLLKIVKNNSNIFKDITSKEIEEDLNKISKKRPIVHKILTWRAKKAAHSDIDIEILKENKLTFEDIKELITIALNIVEKYSEKSIKTTSGLHGINGGHQSYNVDKSYENFISILEYYVGQKKKEHEKMLQSLDDKIIDHP